MSIDLIKTTLAQVGRIPEDGIVPDCDPTLRPGETGACNFDRLLDMASNIVNTLIALAFLAAAFFIIVGGFRLIISQGNPERLKAARANITSAIIGLIVVLTSWVVINSLIGFFVDETRCGYEWYKFEGIKCAEYVPLPELPN
ncbi:MAG: hypothetical protein WD883_01140 [Candidatus Colwellbacteria bacterium]